MSVTGMWALVSVVPRLFAALRSGRRAAPRSGRRAAPPQGAFRAARASPELAGPSAHVPPSAPSARRPDPRSAAASGVRSPLRLGGMIGFLLCAKEGPSVNFLTPINPIEKLEGATHAGREIRFYNSEMHRAAFVLPTFAKRELEAYCASTEREQREETTAAPPKLTVAQNSKILTAS
ncbi:hypothetical protein ACP70R_029349 [Stipagrostis hirtigluma subsp. patula]